MSVALVDAEAALSSLREQKQLDEATHQRFLERARQLHFKQRTWEAVLGVEADHFLDRVLAHPSRKTADAVLLLERLRRGRLNRPAAFNLNLTGYLANLADELGIELEFE